MPLYSDTEGAYVKAWIFVVLNTESEKIAYILFDDGDMYKVKVFDYKGAIVSKVNEITVPKDFSREKGKYLERRTKGDVIMAVVRGFQE